MTQEQKARAYDEALEQARKELNTCGSLDCDAARQIFRFFPKLRENGDEKIRKWIFDLINNMSFENLTAAQNAKNEEWRKKVLAYLEKQKDLDKMIVVSPEVWDNAISEAYENGKKEGEKQKETPEEPKIAFGDWGEKEKKEAIITCLKYMRFIKKITNQEYDDLTEWLDSNLVYNLLGKERYLKQKEQKPSNNNKSEMSDENGHLTGKILVEYGAHAKVRDGKRHCEMEWKEFQRLAHYFYELGKAEQKPYEPKNWPADKDNLTQEQKPAEWSEVKFPKDIEKDATQFCFDKGINITPHQAKEIATHYLMVGHNEGYVEGRKNAHIPARELGLPSSMDFKQGWSEEDEKTRRNLMSLLSCMRGDRITEETYQKYYPWLKSLRPSWKPNDEDEDSKNSK